MNTSIDKAAFLYLVMKVFAQFVRSEDYVTWGHKRQLKGYVSEVKKAPALVCF